MSHSQESAKPVKQPALADLMANYLHHRAEDQAAGLVATEIVGEVVPFEAAPVQTVDPRVAWSEALTALRLQQSEVDLTALAVAPDWPLLVHSQEPQAAPALAVGNYPQLVRHIQPLLQVGKLTELRPTEERPIPANGLLGWVTRKNGFPQVVLALGLLRLARQFEKADALIAEVGTQVPAAWQAAWANERAALAWHRGQGEEALTLWESQAESLPVLFNRGLALLFLGRPADARKPLQKAIAQLATESPWHHLGQLYLALAQMRH